jgi:pyruvate dehydrogenase phosphatase
MSPAWKRSAKLVGLATTGLISYQCTLVFLDHRRQRTSQIVPSVPSVQDVSTVSVRSPVAVLDHAAANAKLRQEARSFFFESNGGAKGRVDLVRLPSNNPIEDEWALAVGKGVGDAKGTLYAGVYDGHA